MSTAVRPSWVSERFGVRLDGDGRLTDLVQLALRRNPRRAHLLVSTVLGKHLPADPRLVHATGLECGERVGALLDGASSLVLGYAETATGLGHCVAEALGTHYLHSTRRAVPGIDAVASFEEEHSHATAHRLLPADSRLLTYGTVAVLVDDEVSTGRTAMNTIAALHAFEPRDRYVIAALVDVRSAASRRALAEFAVLHGVRIDVVALATGEVAIPPDLAARVAALPEPVPAPVQRPYAEVIRHVDCWPANVRESGRHGFSPADVHAAKRAAERVAAALASKCGPRVLVLGTEELMYAPTLIACALAERVPAVRVSSTTRSPVRIVDEPGYPVRGGITFASHDPAADGARFAYNVARDYTDVALVVDSAADTPALTTLVDRLCGLTDRVHVVVLPTVPPLPEPLVAPSFGSYPADDVRWLLTDLAGLALEAPTEEREEAIQSGGAHYAESLPIEYQPDATYQRLFERALDEAAGRVAHAVGIVTELLLAERGHRIVLASLARAGTPIGVLIRQWARFAHGLDLPHYAISIVRGRGIDEAALRYLAARHEPHDVVFVDGWTGKGAIVRELAAAVEAVNDRLGTAFSPELAVLADPGSCVSTFGTRDDFLVPSACLNSTVSGLVSRTVRNDRLLTPGQYDGAKYYRELAGDDRSRQFVAAVRGQFPAVAEAVARDWRSHQNADRRPTWSGWADVEAISARYDIGDVTLVKPGVGETTRVLLRRIPWAVLTRPDAGRDIEHVRVLARQRGVPVHEVEGLSYRCVGLIHPRYTRGATGTDGRWVS